MSVADNIWSLRQSLEIATAYQRFVVSSQVLAGLAAGLGYIPSPRERRRLVHVALEMTEELLRRLNGGEAPDGVDLDYPIMWDVHHIEANGDPVFLESLAAYDKEGAIAGVQERIDRGYFSDTELGHYLVEKRPEKGKK